MTAPLSSRRRRYARSKYAVKAASVTDILSATLDAARWPSSVFRGATRFVLTFVIPLGLMTTVPARALLGDVDGRMVAASLLEACVPAWTARLAWRRGIRHYTSASS